ncbi:hypothetical protein MUK42_33775 [Musa troglodytarum]|uniref:Uncharacterized protein n=1 Tax=Musa troglodytarum TaxID=320322 RepID=A0A9E7GHH8_9LILI|nr:hypothetical protein MUK42_33775 [Musa troglodytarum]
MVDLARRPERLSFDLRSRPPSFPSFNLEFCVSLSFAFRSPENPEIPTLVHRTAPIHVFHWDGVHLASVWVGTDARTLQNRPRRHGCDPAARPPDALTLTRRKRGRSLSSQSLPTLSIHVLGVAVSCPCLPCCHPSRYLLCDDPNRWVPGALACCLQAHGRGYRRVSG